MELGRYVACICEGSAEQAIIERLLDSDKLIFGWKDLLDGDIIRCRNATTFEQRYLRKGFKDKITVLRILDSRSEKFKLSKAYEHKINVVNVITAPEIEMLIILNENKYEEYKRSGLKPSQFCKINLKFTNVKNRKFVSEYFSNVDLLVKAIMEYKRISSVPKNEYSLQDLLK